MGVGGSLRTNRVWGHISVAERVCLSKTDQDALACGKRTCLCKLTTGPVVQVLLLALLQEAFVLRGRVSRSRATFHYALTFLSHSLLQHQSSRGKFVQL